MQLALTHTVFVLMKKALRETQTLRVCARCSKAEPKNFAPAQIPFPGGRRTAKI